MSKRVEARARAFAVEFLLPQATAAHQFVESHYEPDKRVEELANTFGVSFEVVAWQIRNSSVLLSPKVRSSLRQFVRPGSHF